MHAVETTAGELCEDGQRTWQTVADVRGALGDQGVQGVGVGGGEGDSCGCRAGRLHGVLAHTAAVPPSTVHSHAVLMRVQGLPVLHPPFHLRLPHTSELLPAAGAQAAAEPPGVEALAALAAAIWHCLLEGGSNSVRLGEVLQELNLDGGDAQARVVARWMRACRELEEHAALMQQGCQLAGKRVAGAAPRGRGGRCAVCAPVLALLEGTPA